MRTTDDGLRVAYEKLADAYDLLAENEERITRAVSASH